MCGYAEWSRSKWLNEKGVLIDNAAGWLRWMADVHGIPLRWLSDADCQSGRVKGVCQHIDFGSMGGGHVDCGSGWPADVVMERALSGGGGGGGSTQPATGALMAGTCYDSAGREWGAGIWDDGKVNVCTPEGEWYAVDPSQSGARGGATITYDGEHDRLVIAYINGAGDMCTYKKSPNAPRDTWAWANKKGNLKGLGASGAVVGHPGDRAGLGRGGRGAGLHRDRVVHRQGPARLTSRELNYRARLFEKHCSN
jgi:hypothetical protein